MISGDYIINRLISNFHYDFRFELLYFVDLYHKQSHGTERRALCAQTSLDMVSSTIFLSQLKQLLMPVLERIFAIVLSLSEKIFLVLRGILLTSVQPTAFIVLHIHNNILCFVLYNHIFCIENTFICTNICSLRKTRVEGKLLSQSVEYFYLNSVL